MDQLPPGAVAVIFHSRRNGHDVAGYGATAGTMSALAAAQPGYLGVHSVHDPASGEGITVSYWSDDAAARAWKAQADHAAAREQGRADWYDAYDLIVGEVTRAYSWAR